MKEKEKKRRFIESNFWKAIGVVALCIIEEFLIFLSVGILAGAGYIEDTDAGILNTHDGFNRMYFDVMSKHGTLFTVLGFISVILFISILIFEFYAAGHSKDKEDIKLIWIDRIPFDVLTVIFFIIAAECLTILGNLVDSFSFILIMVSCFFIGLSLLFFFYLMSFARRIKAHAFLKNNVIYWLVKQINKGGKMVISLIPVFTRKLLLLLILVISQIVTVNLLGVLLGSAEFYLFVLFSIAVDAILLYTFWMQKVIYDEAAAIRDGDFTKKIPDETIKKMTGLYKVLANNLNTISDGVKIAVEEKMKSERLKTGLITNVSHDIKTPLTSIISYVDLLNKEHSKEEEKEYLAVLTRQTERLKKLTEDVLEASKADSGNVEVHIEKTSMSEIVDQALGEYERKLADANVESVVSVPDDLYVMADGRELWRVLRNLLSNVAKYSVPGSRVYIDAHAKRDRGIIEVKNISKDKLNISPDELMERFVRGDSSRHSEGSGLGLDIARSLMNLMGGEMKIYIDGDLFKVILSLPLAS